ncbi:MAG: glycosyltransferase family 4 protein [Verrucomicrobia bacterium]|nr:glycosyltransferase family 4 protein [Verrucomicrobiota bacterium]
MKIAYLVVKNFYRGGGIEKYTREVATRLVRRGHDVTVFSMGHYGSREDSCDGVKIRYVPCIRKSFAEKLSASASAALAAMWQRPRVDIVHLHSVAAGAFGWLPWMRGIPCVLQMHGIEWQRSRWGSGGRGMLKGLEWLSLRQADALTAVSQVQCDFYRSTNDVQMCCIPTGADIKKPVPPHEIMQLGLQSQKYIFFASRLVREKGAHYLIPAFRKLDTDCRLVIAGDAKGEDAYKAELRQLAAGDERILFPGFVQGRLLEELFSNALLYVQPSEVEGLSIALLEAMSYGNLCVVSDIPENREALGDTGLSFRSRDIDDLRRVLTVALANPQQREELGAQARRRVADNYSWDRITDQLEAVYSELVCNRTKASLGA